MELNKKLRTFFETMFFEVEGPIETLYIKVNLSQSIPATIMLYNPADIYIGEVSFQYNNFIKSIYFSKEKTTINGMKHNLLAGTYRLVIIRHEEESETEEIEMKVIVEKNQKKLISSDYLQVIPWFQDNRLQLNYDHVQRKEARYYRGDFHGHSIYSDGENTPEEVKGLVKSQKLDFIALTEHNKVAFGYKDLGCLVIPSFELTFPCGHVNIHGIDTANTLNKGEISKDLSVMFEKIIDSFTEKANISINHMFMEPWQFSHQRLSTEKINTMEVLCDPTYSTAPKANNKAIAFLDDLWNKGYKIYGIGGSDSHNKYDNHYPNSPLPSVYGDPSTYVFCSGLSVNNVIAGIQKGNCYITRFVEMDIEIMDGEALPGEEIHEGFSKIGYRVCITNFNDENVAPRYIGKFILNGSVIKEKSLTKENPIIDIKINSPQEYWWLRFGLYDQAGNVVAYINPIYGDPIKTEERKIENLIKEFNKNYE